MARSSERAATCARSASILMIRIGGGALINGDRGSYVGMAGGVILLSALQTFLAGTVIPSSAPEI